MDESQNGQPKKKRVSKSTEEILEKEKKEVAELKAKYQKKEAQYNQRLRKERNGQLVALGVLAEMIYKAGGQGAEMLKEAAQANLKDRNLARVLAAFSRIEKEARPAPEPDGQADPQGDAQD